MATTISVVASSTFLCIFLLTIPTTSSVSESEALLNLKNSFGNPSSLVSWKPGTEPCASRNSHWIGVKCDRKGAIMGLSLAHLGLSGKIDVGALSSLPGLRTISFSSNAFSGPLPDLSPLRNLRGLHLSTNKFSGEIPDSYFDKMGALRKLFLAGNQFSGPIPSSLSRLSHLRELHLENNNFSGAIPPFEQQRLASLNVSYNNLSGEIPMSMSRFGPHAFLGNPLLCGGNVTRPCNKAPLEFSGVQIKVIVWVLSALLLFLFALMMLGIFVLKKKQDRNLGLMGNLGPNVSASSGGGKKIVEPSTVKGDMVMMNEDKGVFGLSDLMKAKAEVIGNGTVGSSYKATMISGLTVVVKRVKGMGKIGKDQFESEMRKLGSLKHTNVLAPIAYHYRKEEKLIVHEYQPKGSLLFVLHVDRSISHALLNWPARLKIIKRIARGLSYLHSLELLHGNLKSSNIFLSQEYNPLLSEFGLDSLIKSDQIAVHKTPEAVLQNQICLKSDVYCLGIVILELLTGKFPSYYTEGERGTDVVQWVKLSIVEGKGREIFDPDISNDEERVGEMESILGVGVDCTENDVERRLELAEAVRRIEEVRKDTRTVRFRTASGNLYDNESRDASSFREKMG